MFQTTNQWILRCPKYPNTFFGCSPHFLLLTCGFCREVISTPPRRYHPEHVMQNKSSQTRNQQNKWCRPEATFFYAYDSYDHDISPLFSPEIQAQKTSTMVIYPLKKSETADQLPPQSLTKCHMEVLGSGFRKWSNTSWEVPELFTLSRLITPIALWFIGVIYGHKPTIYVYILVIATIIAMMVYIPMMVYNNGLNDYIVYQHQFHYDISNYLLWSIYQQYLHLLRFLLTNETTSLRGHHLVMGISGEVTGSHFQ